MTLTLTHVPVVKQSVVVRYPEGMQQAAYDLPQTDCVLPS